MTTKAAKIMALHHEGKTSREIALEVYGPLEGKALRTKMAYVRVCAKQRGAKGVSKADLAYLQKPAIQTWRRRYMRDYMRRVRKGLHNEARIG